MGSAFESEFLKIEETLCFVGESDPDEQAILFAVRGPAGTHFGIYTTIFGPGMRPKDVAVVRMLGGKA